jgi:hypothetical protein
LSRPVLPFLGHLDEKYGKIQTKRQNEKIFGKNVKKGVDT